MAELDPHRMLATSVSDFAAEVGAGIARAQRALDQAAFALWKQIETDEKLKDLKEIGYQPTWYAIPVAEAEIKLTFYYEQNTSTTGSVRKMYVLPVNAKTQTTSKLREEGTSQLKLKIVPVPHPTGLSAARKE
jgi:hypothetical protein